MAYPMPLTMAVHSVGSNASIRCATVCLEAKPRWASLPVIDAAWVHSITWPHHSLLRSFTHTLCLFSFLLLRPFPGRSRTFSFLRTLSLTDMDLSHSHQGDDRYLWRVWPRLRILSLSCGGLAPHAVRARGVPVPDSDPDYRRIFAPS